MNKFLALFATLFGIGKLPKAPGTWGSIFALLIAVPLVHFIEWPVFTALILVFFALGVIAANAHAKITGKEDAPEVVIDELVGQWIAILPLEVLGYAQLGDFRYDTVAAFVLFRVFDIWKPWPVSWAEKKIPGGPGVMMDDVIAGVLAALVLLAAGFLRGYFI